MTDWLQAHAIPLVTAAVAIYGAVLSTLNYRHSRGEKQRRLGVRLSGGFLTFGPGVGSHLSDYQCLVEVTNPGHSAAVARSVYITDGTLRIVVPPEHSEVGRLPYELQPGQGCNFWLAAKEVADALASKGVSGTVRLRAVVVDATGGEFQSPRIGFDVDGLRRES